MVNKQGQTRVSQYYQYYGVDERKAMEGEIVRKCLSRNEHQCSFMEYQNYKLVYRRYASLFFIIGVDTSENELAILELIHNLVELLDTYFKSVCELDIMFNLERVYMILDEMVMNGCIVETNRTSVLSAINLYEMEQNKKL